MQTTMSEPTIKNEMEFNGKFDEASDRSYFSESIRDLKEIQMFKRRKICNMSVTYLVLFLLAFIALYVVIGTISTQRSITQLKEIINADKTSLAGKEQQAQHVTKKPAKYVTTENAGTAVTTEKMCDEWQASNGSCFSRTEVCSGCATSLDDIYENHTSSCPSGWEAWGQNCYKYFGMFVTWQQANDFCQLLPSLMPGRFNNIPINLISIHSSAEQDFAYMIWTNNSPGSLHLWIGLNDIESESTFVWSDSTPKDYDHWHYTQPNTGGSEDAGLMENDGQWHDYPHDSCGYKYEFMCKMLAL